VGGVWNPARKKTTGERSIERIVKEHGPNENGKRGAKAIVVVDA